MPLFNILSKLGLYWLRILDYLAPMFPKLYYRFVHNCGFFFIPPTNTFLENCQLFQSTSNFAERNSRKDGKTIPEQKTGTFYIIFLHMITVLGYNCAASYVGQVGQCICTPVAIYFILTALVMRNSCTLAKSVVIQSLNEMSNLILEPTAHVQHVMHRPTAGTRISSYRTRSLFLHTYSHIARALCFCIRRGLQQQDISPIILLAGNGCSKCCSDGCLLSKLHLSSHLHKYLHNVIAIL